jgi:hypothetical protein
MGSDKIAKNLSLQAFYHLSAKGDGFSSGRRRGDKPTIRKRRKAKNDRVSFRSSFSNQRIYREGRHHLWSAFPATAQCQKSKAGDARHESSESLPIGSLEPSRSTRILMKPGPRRVSTYPARSVQQPQPCSLTLAWTSGKYRTSSVTIISLLLRFTINVAGVLPRVPRTMCQFNFLSKLIVEFVGGPDCLQCWLAAADTSTRNYLPDNRRSISRAAASATSK